MTNSPNPRTQSCIAPRHVLGAWLAVGASALACGGPMEADTAEVGAAVGTRAPVDFAAALRGTTVAEEPSLAAVNVGAGLTLPILCGNKRIGTVHTSVRKNVLGTIDLYYRWQMESAAAGSAWIYGWNTPFDVDVDYRLDGLGDIPAGRDSATAGWYDMTGIPGYPAGAGLGFFADWLRPGQSSRFYFVRTGRRTFSQDGRFLLWTGAGGFCEAKGIFI